MPTQLGPVWTEIASALRAEVTADIYDRWFKEPELVEMSREHLTLRVPNDIYRYWIEDNYLTPLRTAVLMTLKSAREVRFISAGMSQVPDHTPESARPVAEVEVEEPEERSIANGFNPNNSFETFVV